MFSKFTEEARKVLVSAKKEMSELKHPYVGSEHLLLAILKNKNSNIAKKLKEYNLDYNSFRKEIINVIGIGTEVTEWYLYTPLLKKVIEDAMIESKEEKSEVTVEMLFSSLIHEGEGIAIRIMLAMNIDFDSIMEEFNVKSAGKKIKSKKKLMIDEYGYDLNKKVRQDEIDPVIGRNNEIERLIEILCRRTKNNPLLIGEAGVGKTAIVEELSRRIVQGLVPNQLKNKRVVSVSVSSLVAGTKYRGEFEERITKMLKELESDNNVIIFIDEMHTLVGAGGAEGAIDASNILKPILARGKIKIIGATTIEEYKKYIEEDRALARRFQTIMIEEPNPDKTKDILLKLRPIYEKYHNVLISDEVIETIVKLSDRYIYNRKQPDKAIDILDEAAAKVSVAKDKNVTNLKTLREELRNIIEKKNKAIIEQDFNNAAILRKNENQLETKINKLEEKRLKNKTSKVVTTKTIAEVISLKTRIPVYELEQDDFKNILKLKKEMQNKIKGQDEAIDKLYQISKRIKLGFKEENKPVSLLFAGPTGVGKTLLVKEFSKLLVGSNNLITLDMSEYKEEHTISKIVGSPPGYVGYSNKNTVVEEIKNKPYSVILVDEIEKAHPSVINLFLQILDEGRIKDSKGNNIRLDHNIIIMTSNIGFNRNTIGFHKSNNNIVESKLKDFLSPEIMNRIDDVIIFNKLDREDTLNIVVQKLKKLKEKFKKNNIDIHISNKVIDQIIDESKFDEYGARKIDKIIRTKVDNIIIDELLLGKNKFNIRSIY